MKKNSFISKISYGFSFLQIVIYILDCVTANGNISYCSSKANFNAHIINRGILYFRFLNFASYSNGNMVFLTSSIGGTKSDQETRIFYGIKENGRPLFFFY